ncbi:DUF1127 domain-containing protein [Paracoccus sp. P2]|uniref:DUF1127 domain-containing protein n=1 Tax=Paracoccus pantotrophus TaxID=82367 RepID=A0A1I5HUF0_PARPN|nr:DUF1127 domain-containing protein [Paracoccus pantotrophus]MDF3854872.1 DUF1127 domain-containing protein [Paracoccus pantotrophus]QFG38359.1 DUF1127 domain-containing protein [Paracoccus pantotrophus]QLH15913.1 DUF1127 domain-containing protein [Paracoccus pantotrophus]RDD96527.1 DUF1127 domain-containing protein [Paracoccus pantotrophus]RKS51120.1 uncharacterized protein DUF1127 [Paracoccus pantotrophus]
MSDHPACDRERPFLPVLPRLFALLRRDKPSLSPCLDRMAALDHPATRRALADLPEHLLRDIGVTDTRSDAATPSQDGEALRRHLW